MSELEDENKKLKDNLVLLFITLFALSLVSGFGIGIMTTPIICHVKKEELLETCLGRLIQYFLD